jgi:predicted PurR-regulated permease PerM
MKVYTFTHHAPVTKKHLKSGFGFVGFNSNKQSRHVRHNNINFLSFLENKFTSQVIAILCLTVAVFIAVQGLFGSTAPTVANAASLDSNVKVIINYNTNTLSDKSSVDNSKLVDAPESTLLDTSSQPNSNLQTVSNTSTSDKVGALSKK